MFYTSQVVCRLDPAWVAVEVGEGGWSLTSVWKFLKDLSCSSVQMPLEIGDGCDVLQSFNENLEKKTSLNNQLKDLEKKHPRIFRDSSKKKLRLQI